MLYLNSYQKGAIFTKNTNYFTLPIAQLLKYKSVGKLAEFISLLNELKKFLFSRQVVMHQVNVPIVIFIRQNLNILYAKCPKKIKNVLSKEIFAAFLLIVSCQTAHCGRC